MQKPSNPQEASAVATMAETAGWEHTALWIENQISIIAKSLLSADPNDLVDIGRRQGRATAYTEVLQWVAIRARRIKED